MNITLDISQIAYKGTGVSRFVNGLANAILEYDMTNRWTFFYSSLRQELSPEIKRKIHHKKHHLAEYRLPPTALSFLWNSMHRMKIEKLVGNADWIITSDWTEPPSRKRKATIIHDLAYIRHPETVHPLIRKTQQKRMHWVKKESAIVFADSEATKNDIVELLDIPEKKIYVNYPGVELIGADKDTIADTLRKHHLVKPFILTVGKIEPRKNLRRLIDAFKKINGGNVDLVVVGAQGWDTETSKKQSEERNIRFLGYVSETELSALYRSCMLFVYPSLYEGFGYPVVEAMIAGAPVATSRTSSLLELGRDAAMLFDPEDVTEICDAVSKLVHDHTLRDFYAKKGIMKSQEFSWKRYYDKMISVLNGHSTIS